MMSDPYDERTDAERYSDDALQRIADLTSLDLAEAIQDYVDAVVTMREEDNHV
jgi:hypothetical protein